MLLTPLALAIALFVVVPVLAHRLRRREADVRPFPAAKLVPPTPPKARKRSKIEDKALLAVRALVVLALALLGASPFVKCSHLSLDREGGASVALAIVLDDSGSMRAPAKGTTKSRFETAKAGATQLLSSAREGDAIAVVLGGAPPRVLLAPTTDLAAAKAAIDDAVPSDRATDLEGAIAVGEGLLKDLPHVDKKLVLLSDLADGKATAPPLGRGSTLPLGVPLVDLAEKVADCAIVSADRSGTAVRVRVACSPGDTFAGRSIEVLAGGKAIGASPGVASSATEILVKIPADAPVALVAAFATPDRVPTNDRAPVLSEAGPSAIAVVADTATETTVTGGAPVVEQAFTALRGDLSIRPLPQLPESPEDLASFAGILVDDPPGLTPEQRRAVTRFVAGGGVVLFALGPRAAEAPLGATFEPILGQAVTWEKNPAAGATATSAHALFAESAKSLTELFAQKRIVLGVKDLPAFESLLAFSDGAPLLGRRVMGPGEAWIVTLPFSVDDSDLVLRPGFLSILDNFADAARRHSAPRRSEVGMPWLFASAVKEIKGPDERAVPSVKDADGTRVVPGLAGIYTLVVDGQRETRVASFPTAELDTTPRKVEGAEASAKTGGVRTQTEISWVFALLLLALTAAELVMRAIRKPATA